jgi:hypothetical protein
LDLRGQKILSNIVWQNDIMGKQVKMIGNKYGRLVAIKQTGKDNNGYRYLFNCDCGNQKDISGVSVRSGHTLSCGCIKSETTAARNFVHGMVHSGSYKSWQAMKTRCTNHKQLSNSRYAELGYDPNWGVFENFVRDMGERPYGMTLDRIDNSKGYSKDNCRWATPAEQNRNTRQNLFITHNGKTQCMKDWSNETGIPYPTIQDRVKRNKTPAEILER